MSSGPAPLPNAPSVEIQADVILQPPLSRCGHGPGLLLIRPRAYVTCQSNNTSLDPEPLQKWAEESFAVVQVTLDAQSSGIQSTVSDLVRNAVQVLTELPECETKDKFGLIVYGSPTDYAPQFEEILRGVAGGFTAAIYFAPWSTPDVPVLLHAPGKYSEQAPTSRTVYSYPDASSPGFILPGHADFDINFGNTAHTRSLTFIKKQLGGPYFDLEKIWDEHTYYEFGDRSVEKTMATMVQEPYVNHVPTASHSRITGGIGREFLTKFYRENFIFSNPDDTKLELISRTVGVDRIVDEFIFCMTHDKVVDALIPGVPATGKKLRIPFTSVVNIRGDRLYHEHIAWDQATVLIQLGLLPDYLPFPYPVDGKLPAPGKRFEYRVPAGGVETANKLQDETSVPSNEMIAYTIREVDDK